MFSNFFFIMSQSIYKRNYHPLVILFYTYGMLDSEQLNAIPKNTRSNWNKFKHEHYDCTNWVAPYLLQFDDLKSIFMREHLRKTILIMISISDGFHKVLSSITKKKSLIKDNALSIITSIDTLVRVSNIKIARVCNFYGVTKDWYYREKRKIICSISPFKLCYKQYPNQLTFNEVRNIERAIFDPINFGKTKTTIYYTALNNGLFYCAKSTFYKYATSLGYQKAKHKNKLLKKGFRASRIFEWLHVDITYVPTLEDGMQKVAFIKDNYSKGLLHYKTTNGRADSKFIAQLFQETFDKHNLFNKCKPINILSDGGSENKGELLSWVKHIKAPSIVNKITARTVEFPHSNSMSESTHSIYKTEFLKKQISKNIIEHHNNLLLFFDYYNNERFPTELFGCTPLQVLNGKIPNKLLFKELINQARKDRVVTNKNFNDCPILSV